jgi:predicted dehydrogenase
MANNSNSNGPLQLGILSTAKIARGFVQAVLGSKLVHIASVASRSQTTADAFAAEFKLPRAYGSYEAMLADPAIAAVYIALPNSLHEAWTVKALNAGKHVLCEKPLVRGAARAKALFDLARSKNLVLLEAFPYAFQPQTQQVLQAVQSQSIGQVVAVQTSFGFTVADPNNVRFDPLLDGGAVMDAGCYCISFVRQIMGERGQVEFAKAQWTDRGVDIMMQASLRFSGNRYAQIMCNMNSSPVRQATILASQGAIQTDFVNHTDDRPSYFDLKQGAGWDDHFSPQTYEHVNGFVAEAEAFANMIQTRDWSAVDHWASVSEDTAGMLDDILNFASPNI